MLELLAFSLESLNVCLGHTSPPVYKASIHSLLHTTTQSAKLVNLGLDICEGFIDLSVGTGGERPTNDHPLPPDVLSHVLNTVWRFPEIGFAPFYLAHIFSEVFGTHLFLAAKKIQ